MPKVVEDEQGTVFGEVHVKPPGLPGIHLENDDVHGADGDVPGATVGDVQVKLHGLCVIWYDRDALEQEMMTLC